MQQSQSKRFLYEGSNNKQPFPLQHTCEALVFQELCMIHSGSPKCNTLVEPSHWHHKKTNKYQRFIGLLPSKPQDIKICPYICLSCNLNLVNFHSHRLDFHQQKTMPKRTVADIGCSFLGIVFYQCLIPKRPKDHGF